MDKDLSDVLNSHSKSLDSFLKKESKQFEKYIQNQCDVIKSHWFNFEGFTSYIDLKFHPLDIPISFTDIEDGEMGTEELRNINDFHLLKLWEEVNLPEVVKQSFKNLFELYGLSEAKGTELENDFLPWAIQIAFANKSLDYVQ